jgi:hypothetical protein
MLFQKAVRFFVLVSAVAALCVSTVVRAEDRASLERHSQAALNSLIAQNASARDLSKRAVAVLVFPEQLMPVIVPPPPVVAKSLLTLVKLRPPMPRVLGPVISPKRSWT